MEFGVVGGRAQLGDDDALEAGPQGFDHVAQEVMGHGTRWGHPLDGEGDGRRLRGTDEDRQGPAHTLRLGQQQDRGVRLEVHSHRAQPDFDHACNLPPVELVDVRFGVVFQSFAVPGGHESQVAVPAGHVEAVAEKELIRGLEARESDRDGHDPAGQAVEQGADLHRSGPTPAQFTEDVGGGEPGVHDVLHQDDVPIVDVVVEVLHDPDAARPLGVGGDTEEVHLTGDGHRPDQVGQEQEAALEHGHQQHTGRIGLRELGPEPGRDGGHLGAIVEDPGAGAPRHPPSWSRRALRSRTERSAWPRRDNSATLSRARWRASGLRCLSRGKTICSMKPASRSAACLCRRR